MTRQQFCPFPMQRVVRCSWAAAALMIALVGGNPAWAQRDLKNIPDPDPQIELDSFQVADGFQVNLFAADPLLAKPIEMSFDASGRLWVASSEIYPQVKPGQQADDKILILEDVDGDGKADKTTVFANGLLIPTGVEPGDGGAYVANSTELVFLKDTDGDGKADSRRVMLSGFGTEDTHHIVHTFRWGPDGMLYFNQSIYIHSHLETPFGVRRLGGGGIWQFRPETLELEVFMRGLWNPWGHAWDYWGQSFVTDGAGGQGINYAFPGATFEATPGATRVLPGLNPGSPKYCGLEVVDGRALPNDYQGSLITNDFRAHRVCRFVVSEDGAGFASREQPELIKTTHPAFRPIDVKLGPDGAIYIADWYNPIIQHGEVDFRDPRRDHTHGRIWRVTAKDRPSLERPRLTDASTPEVLEQLKSPESWTRHFAKRVLKERGADIAPEVGTWAANLPQAHADFEHFLLEALWTYQSLDVVEPKLLEQLLTAHDPHARAAAVRVLGQWHTRLPDPAATLGALALDDHPRVRLEAVRALALLKTARAAELAMQALDKPVDRFLEHALFLTARDLQPYWLPELAAGQIDFGGDPRRLAFVISAAGSADVIGPLVALIRTGKLTADRQTSALGMLANLGGPAELSLVLDRLIAEQAHPNLQADLLRSLAHAARQRKAQPAGDLTRIKTLLASTNDDVRQSALQVVGAWRAAELMDLVVPLATGSEVSPPVRRAALHALAGLGTAEAKRQLVAWSNDPQPPATRIPGIEALAQVDPVAAAAPAVDVLGQAPADADLRLLIVAFLERQHGPEALAKALDSRKIPYDAAKLATRVVRDWAVEQPQLLAALARAGGLNAIGKQISPAESQQIVAAVSAEGKADRGEAIFRRSEQACLKCHAIGGAGGRVGPDLSSLGASAQVDYILESILLPSAKIKENFHSLIVATDDGMVYSGIKVGENDADLVLRDADDHEVVIPKGSIEERKEGGSLMPVGLVDNLSRAELVDLVRFVSELGKVGPYAVGNARVVRRWQVLADSPAARRAVATGHDAILADSSLTWTPLYSRVSGDLPAAEVPPIGDGGSSGKPHGFVRFQLDVTTAGPVEIVLAPGAVRHIWLDGKKRDNATAVMLDLSMGQHTVTLAVDPAAGKPIRVELNDVVGSAARVQLVGGK